ncbi:esterase-like activity of phytase family protein [Endozoicomonas lisbonensis]|uniref:Phytase-like domain-containing protein n=1 Tax=Endozoicomonas lisbonensis TaxID=3120522 RepID=A0ABV2SFB0_9GAMM
MRKIIWLLPLLLLLQTQMVSAAASQKKPPGNKYTYRGTVLLDYTKDQPVLGISSLRYDKKSDQFIIVSDDTGVIPNLYEKIGKPRFYTLSGQAVLNALNVSTQEQVSALNSSFIDETHLTVEPDEYQWNSRKNWIQDGHIDTEGLALFNNSTDLLISSEQGATYPAKTFRMQRLWDIYNAFRVPDVDVAASLLRVDRDFGILTQRYYLPSYYNTPLLRSTLSYLLPETVMNAYDWATSENQGLQRNRGIESIDFIPGTNEVIAITEMPLRQDIAPWKAAFPADKDRPPIPPPCRIIHLTLDEFRDGSQFYPIVKKELLYGIARMPDKYTQDATATIKTGVSDVLALNDSEILVVERTRITFAPQDQAARKRFEPEKPVSIVEIYKVNLNLEKQYHVTKQARLTPEMMGTKRVVKKALLFSTLQATEKDVFENMNIEGITKGPEIDGKETIVLVNDNDAGKGDVTKLIFLTVDQ